MKIVEHAPQARMVLVNRCGHWVQVEHREMFNRQCIDFLRMADTMDEALIDRLGDELYARCARGARWNRLTQRHPGDRGRRCLPHLAALPGPPRGRRRARDRQEDRRHQQGGAGHAGRVPARLRLSSPTACRSPTARPSAWPAPAHPTPRRRRDRLHAEAADLQGPGVTREQEDQMRPDRPGQHRHRPAGQAAAQPGAGAGVDGGHRPHSDGLKRAREMGIKTTADRRGRPAAARAGRRRADRLRRHQRLRACREQRKLNAWAC
jgi:hypothetical protein